MSKKSEIKRKKKKRTEGLKIKSVQNMIQDNLKKSRLLLNIIFFL